MVDKTNETFPANLTAAGFYKIDEMGLRLLSFVLHLLDDLIGGSTQLNFIRRRSIKIQCNSQQASS